MHNMIPIAAPIVLIGGPLLFGRVGRIRARRVPAGAAPSRAAGGSLPSNWRLTVVSALLYTLAFNLTFFGAGR